MKPFAHTAKLAFLTDADEVFVQLEDRRILIVKISRGQLAGLVADGAKRLATSAVSNNRTGDGSESRCSLSASESQHQHGAHESSTPSASAATPRPQSEVADALIPGERA